MAASKIEVLRDALRAIDRRDAMFDEWLRTEVKTSMADKRPSMPAEKVFRRLEVRHGCQVKAAKRGA